MYLNPAKSRVSNVDEILNRASLQLKGIINVGTSENDLDVRKSKKSDWRSIDDISDVSISEDSSEAKPKRTNRFIKKKNDDESISKPFRTGHFTNDQVEKSVNSHANAGQNNNINISKFDANRAAADDFGDMIGHSDSETSKMKNKFTRKDTIASNKTSNKIEEKDTSQKKTLDLNNTPVTRKVKLEATSTFKMATSDLELEASIDEVVEEDLENEHGNVRDGRGLRSNDVTVEEIKMSDNNDSYTADDIDEDDDDNDDDIFGNIQADASELIKAFEPEKDAPNNVGNNHSDDSSDHHQNIKQTSKAAFSFNANVSSSKLKDDPFHTKVKATGQSRSLFHAPKNEKKVQKKKQVTRNDYVYDDDDDDVIEEESIRSHVDDLSSIKTETYSPSPVGRSKSMKVLSTSNRSTSSSGSSSSRSSTSKGTKSSQKRSSKVTRVKPGRSPTCSLTESSMESYTNSFASFPSEGGSKRSQKRLINTGVQTGLGLNMNENHWLLDGHQSFEFKFKDVERKFLTSREGISSLMDLTSFTPAMSCLNNIIKQQVSLLATFVANQKSLHKQIIESTNRKAPYKYTTLSDKH